MNKLVAGSLLGAFLLYFFCLPFTVQTNDTGELVANAYKLHLIHPPGYPLYLWLYHGFLNLVPVSTPFFRASLFTSILACGTLAALCFLPGARSPLGLLLLATLATSRIFWNYAVLPDVFMLHLLIVAGCLWAFFSKFGLRRKLYILAILMALGVANHHTVIFLAPLFFVTAWENKSWRDLILTSLTSLGLVILLYVSLMPIADGHILDWRTLNSFADLIHHFLRVDYGTFQLSGAFESPSYFGLLALMTTTLNLSIPLLLFGAIAGTVLTLREPRKDLHYLTLVGVLVSYVVIFLPLCNLPIRGFFVELLERFFLMPAVILAALGLIGLQKLWPNLRGSIQKLILVAAGISLLFNLLQKDRFDYSQDTLVEDYVIDLLNRAASKKPSVLLTSTDTVLFAAGYVQSAKGFQPQVPVLFLGGAQREHLPTAARALVPQLKYEIETAPVSQQDNKFVQANIGEVSIFTMLPIQTAGGSLRTYRVGYEVIPQPETEPYADDAATTHRTSHETLSTYGGRVSLRMHSLRCQYELVHADYLYKQKDYAQTLARLTAAINDFPTCFPAKERQCQLLSEQPSLGKTEDCQREYQVMQEIYAQDFADFAP